MNFWQSGAPRFFVTQALGILLEDIVRVQWRHLQLNKRDSNMQKMLLRIRRRLGYLWVLVFLVWSTPVWVYPAIAVNRGEPKDRVLPFSILSTIWE